MEQDTREPADDSGEEIPTFFCEKREMTSLGTSPRRQTYLLRASAHRNGLLVVTEVIFQQKHIFAENPVDSVIFHQKHSLFLIC
jgi:hypothetical protein